MMMMMVTCVCERLGVGVGAVGVLQREPTELSIMR